MPARTKVKPGETTERQAANAEKNGDENPLKELTGAPGYVSTFSQSESIDKLTAAMVKVQGQVCEVVKDAEGYGYDYVTLGTTLAAIKDLCASNGLAVIQWPLTEGRRMGVTTIISHTSGQWMRSAFSLCLPPLTGSNTQTQREGSAITYARRYALSAIFGLAAVDDDGMGEE